MQSIIRGSGLPAIIAFLFAARSVAITMQPVPTKIQKNSKQLTHQTEEYTKHCNLKYNTKQSYEL